jgi:D-sedoheptulose 7-phosphate isomerase
MIKDFLEEVKVAIDGINPGTVQKMANILSSSDRVFFIGCGGGAGNSSHAVADFRKLCNIESFALENICELTSRINDDGFDMSIVGWLKGSHFNNKDCLFVFSVGGGQPGISQNLVKAMEYAHNNGAKIIGITGRRNSVLYGLANACIVIESKYPTPITEGLQSVIHHLLVTMLQKNKPVWQ